MERRRVRIMEMGRAGYLSVLLMLTWVYTFFMRDELMGGCRYQDVLEMQ